MTGTSRILAAALVVSLAAAVLALAAEVADTGPSPRVLTRAEGLPNSWVKGLFLEGNDLWISAGTEGAGGIAVYRVRTGKLEPFSPGDVRRETSLRSGEVPRGTVVLWKPPAGYLDAYRRLHDLLKPTGPVDAVVSLLAIAIAPAVCEDLVFRGVALPAFVRWGAPAAAVASSLLFGAIHLDGSPGGLSLYRVPFAFTVGLGLAAIRLRTGALGPAILAHATLNSITFVAAPLASPPDASLPDPRPLLGLGLFVAGLLTSAAVSHRLLPPLTAPRRPLDYVDMKRLLLAAGRAPKVLSKEPC